MLTIEQQDNILSGDASFHTFNVREARLDLDKWYYLYLEIDHHQYDYGMRVYVKYILSDKDGMIFTGNDFGASPLLDPLGDKAAESLLSFLVLGKHDGVEDEYFADYTPRQFDFRDCEAEDLWVWREMLNPEEHT